MVGTYTRKWAMGLYISKAINVVHIAKESSYLDIRLYITLARYIEL